MKKFIESIDLVNVSAGTWVRMAQMIISIVIMIFKAFGIVIPSIDENIIINIVALVFALISFLQCFWKNNSFTNAAQVADIYMQKFKKEATE